MNGNVVGRATSATAMTASHAGGVAPSSVIGDGVSSTTRGWPRICIVGPLPPPAGGMANQCAHLVRLLRHEGADVTLVRTNAPYQPAWIGRIPVLRAGLRLLPYLLALRRGIAGTDVVHVLANSGWAWHLLAWPALLIARWYGVGAIVDYHGGHADAFFSAAPRHVLRALKAAAMRVSPSAFLVRVFDRHGLDARVIPNIIDLSRFTPRSQAPHRDAPHLVVTRNLETIYDIATAVRAFALVRMAYPAARLTVAGDGPERDALQALVDVEGLRTAVHFTGRIDNLRIVELYHAADCMLNPSTVDNMPISILEAMACGVPVVSTDAGGIPDMVESGVTALLVPVGDHRAMADAALQLLGNPERADGLRQAATASVQRFAWSEIRELWHRAYWQVAALRSTS